MLVNTLESGKSHQVLNSDIDTGAISAADLIEDAKFYQDTALGYQDAYETLHSAGGVTA